MNLMVSYSTSLQQNLNNAHVTFLDSLRQRRPHLTVTFVD